MTILTIPASRSRPQFGIFARVVGRIRLEFRIRRDTARLEGMDDFMLRDIGLTRGEICSADRFGCDWKRLNR